MDIYGYPSNPLFFLLSFLNIFINRYYIHDDTRLISMSYYPCILSPLFPYYYQTKGRRKIQSCVKINIQPSFTQLTHCLNSSNDKTKVVMAMFKKKSMGGGMKHISNISAFRNAKFMLHKIFTRSKVLV